MSNEHNHDDPCNHPECIEARKFDAEINDWVEKYAAEEAGFVPGTSAFGYLRDRYGMPYGVTKARISLAVMNSLKEGPGALIELITDGILLEARHRQQSQNTQKEVAELLKMFNQPETKALPPTTHNAQDNEWDHVS